MGRPSCRPACRSRRREQFLPANRPQRLLLPSSHFHFALKRGLTLNAYSAVDCLRRCAAFVCTLSHCVYVDATGGHVKAHVCAHAKELSLWLKPGVVPGSLETAHSQASAVACRTGLKRQFSRNPTTRHTSRLNGPRSCLPRERTVKPLFHPRPSGSISLVRLCRSSAAITAGFR